MQYDVYLNGKYCTSSPTGMPEDRVRLLVDETLQELQITGVVEVRPHLTPEPVKKRRRSSESLPRLVR